MANRVRSQAIKEVAAAAARLSPLHTRMWWVPARADANPTMQAMSANGKNVPVMPLPAIRRHSTNSVRNSHHLKAAPTAAN